MLFDIAMLVPLLADWLWDVCPRDKWLQRRSYKSGNDANNGIDRWNLLFCHATAFSFLLSPSRW